MTQITLRHGAVKTAVHIHVQVCPGSGEVSGWIDLTGLKSRVVPPHRNAVEYGTLGRAVLNGLAYDQADRRLFVTGKR